MSTGQEPLLERNALIEMWMMRGIEDLFLSFRLDKDYQRLSPFLCAMGVEMVCKAYLLGHEDGHYSNQPYWEGLAKANEIARKKFSHDLRKIVDRIVSKSTDGNISILLNRKFDAFTGEQFLEVLQSAYLECRYPVPNPIHKKYPFKYKENIFYHDILRSSGLEKFAHALTRQVLLQAHNDFGIKVSPDFLDKLRPKRVAVRFKRLFFRSDRRQLIARRSG